MLLVATHVEQEEREIEEAARVIVGGTPIDVEDDEEPVGEPREGVKPNDTTRNVPSAREANQIAGATSSNDVSTEEVATLAILSIESQPSSLILTQHARQSPSSINSADLTVMSGDQPMTNLTDSNSTSGLSGEMQMSEFDTRLHT